MKRIVIFTSNPTYSVRKGIRDLYEQLPEVEWLVLHSTGNRSLSRLLRNQWRNLKRNGWRWIPYQAADVVDQIKNRFGSRPSTLSPAPGQQFSLDALESLPRLKLERAVSLTAPAVLEQIREFAPDLGISLAAPILKPATFEQPKLGTINLHKGKLPDYRGMPPAFWELWHDEQEVGCSVHKVEAKLDTGELLERAVVKRQDFSTLGGLQAELDEVGVRLVRHAVLKLAQGGATYEPQGDGGNTYSKPTLQQFSELKSKLPNTTRGDSGAKRLLKNTLFSGYRRFAQLRRSILSTERRIVVLLYHRVNDTHRDSVTVGVEQFDRHMALIRDRYPVISVDDIVTDNIPENTGKPIVAVTFDDGYLDNYQHAVPALLKNQMPAAFFVSTKLMGSEQGFQHDLDKLGTALPNMDWSQLKEMADLGFTIGSHTETHINCAKGNPDEVIKELHESKKTLIQRLGLNEVLFAYPFGGRDDMNAAMLEEVKNAGYPCCFSAYGGINSGAIDKFNILRMGVDFNFSDQALLARIEGFS